MEEQKPETNSIKSPKEERIRRICLSYYSRPDVRKAMFEFSKNRECIPRYFEGFGKRPDSFQFDADIPSLARKGATSFHCSEEIWRDPMEISTELNEEELKNLRSGWDLLIDIDCKYIEYSKKAAVAIIQALNKNGVENAGVKFSGGKGFHIIVPFASFPSELSGKKASEMFPEWPRLICEYLKEQSREFLEKDLYASEDSAVLSRLKKGIRCEKCKKMAEKSELVLFSCDGCRTKMENLTSSFERKRIIRCPNCQREMRELQRDSVYKCSSCNIDSRKNPHNFNEAFESIDIFEVLGLDVILVSPRHLFRMPYSLHEKTALASIVLSKDKIREFDIKDADPMKVKTVNFLPDSREGEATTLLMNALEFAMKNQTREEEDNKKKKELRSKSFDGIEKIERKSPLLPQYGETEGKDGKRYSNIPLGNVSQEFYPPSIKTILLGMKSDGRKRALFILLSFFTSLKLTEEETKEKVDEWNKKNFQPLRDGYIRSQISWYFKQKSSKLPPNFDKSYYKDIGITPSEDELAAKNPINYVARKVFSRKSKTSR